MINNVNLPLEIFGYIGTVLVIVSMLMTSLTKLRIINVCGAIISTIYSIIVGAWPIVVMNICLMCINIFHIVTAYTKRTALTDVTVKDSDASLVHFLNTYEDRIKRDFSEYDLNISDEYEYHLVYLDSRIIAFFRGKRKAEAFLSDISFILPDSQDVSEKQIYASLLSGDTKAFCIKADGKKKDKLLRFGFTEQDGYIRLNL